MCLAAASYALAASSAVSNVPSHNRAPRFGSRISAAQLFVVCLLMSASLFNKKKEYFCGEFGKRNFAPSKKRKISKRKRGKKRKFFFSYLPHGLCRTPRYTEEHCFLVFVLVDPPCWAVVPPPPSKEEGSSLAFCFKTKTKKKKKWGLLEEETKKKKSG